MVTVDEELCVGCGLCVTVCPTEALKVWGYWEIDGDKCTDCFDCIGICPVEALRVEK